MRDAERWWAVAVGGTGLLSWVVGTLLVRLPPIDGVVDVIIDDLRARRTAVLAGSVLVVSGTTALLWPITLVASAPSPDRWPSLAAASGAVAVLGFAVLAVATVGVAAVAWRSPDDIDSGVVRVVLDAGHLATWSLSAPIGAASTVATTVVAVQADLAGPLLVALAVAKVATVALEVAGVGRRTGWNAGGWAAGSSGYVTVAWFAALLLALAPA